MRIVSLEPWLTHLTAHFGLLDSLVAVSHRCRAPHEVSTLAPATKARPPGAEQSALARAYRLETGICADVLDLDAFRRADPDVVLTSIPAEQDISHLILGNVREDVAMFLGHDVSVFSYSPLSLDSVFACYEQLARDLGVPDKGIDLAHRQKAQFMDWCDNFYDRTKSKKVCVIASLEPYKVAGGWIADMIRLCSGGAYNGTAKGAVTVEWHEIADWRPDVILVVPEGLELQESLKTFKLFEKLPGWENIPAAKRGEVFFCDGAEHFYQPGAGLMESMAILVSAVAGFESGYITPRDSFYKLRWLEMQRHRF